MTSTPHPPRREGPDTPHRPDGRDGAVPDEGTDGQRRAGGRDGPALLDGSGVPDRPEERGRTDHETEADGASGHRVGGGADADGAGDPRVASLEAEIGRVREPARLLRVSTMARSLLDEARGLALDEHTREQLWHLHARVVAEIGDSVAPELRDELDRLLPEPSHTLSQSEVRIAHSQLVGWLEGVFQGIRVGMTVQRGIHHPDAPHSSDPHGRQTRPDAGYL
ncbi:hypothetical protein GCM10022224_054790 [Nonomuraea antimicrobica]|uniref:Bacterial proteasome activator n=1 Tax=Nonomuraea antimicrobica TaxID=561173 RepID=A0ABP7CB89_9ACTN